MSFLDRAAADVAAILQDSDTGFGLAMVLTNPDGLSQDVTGFAADIGTAIDSETLQPVSGRTVHVSLPLAALTIGTPRGILDESKKPWLITLKLPNDSVSQDYKVTETQPDKIGCINCFLTTWTV